MIVIWEPILGLDIAPPSPANLARLSDPRVAQFWDGQRLVSDALLQSARTNPEKLSQRQQEQLAKAKVVWDFVGLFPAGTRWNERKTPPFPDYSGAPVVDVIDGIKSRIANAIPEIEQP